MLFNVALFVLLEINKQKKPPIRHWSHYGTSTPQNMMQQFKKEWDTVNAWWWGGGGIQDIVVLSKISRKD